VHLLLRVGGRRGERVGPLEDLADVASLAPVDAGELQSLGGDAKSIEVDHALVVLPETLALRPIGASGSEELDDHVASEDLVVISDLLAVVLRRGVEGLGEDRGGLGLELRDLDGGRGGRGSGMNGGRCGRISFSRRKDQLRHGVLR